MADNHPTVQAGGNLLSMLKDIHPAQPASWWPPAPGWWLLSILLVAMIWWSSRRLLQFWRSYRFKRMVQGLLDELFLRYRDQPREMLVGLNQLLKRWLYSQGKSGVQNLSGKAWSAYLQAGSVKPSDTEIALLDILANAHYHSQVEAFDQEALKVWASAWLKNNQVKKIKGGTDG